jgi:glycosyltransferase involved in cell wall biosynthesis
MKQHFRERYNCRAGFLQVPPTIVSQQLGAAVGQPRKAFTVGFLSNLTIAKGLDDAIGVLERLAVSSRPVRLILAGPCMAAEEQAIVDNALARWPDLIEYRGPVFGSDKAQFFADIDAFLFPTRYANESWGIVLTEALSAGCPVIARSRGCVRWIVQHGCGLVVDRDGDFVGEAARQIAAWMDSPADFQAARAAATQRAAEMNKDAARELSEFVECALGRS